MPRVILEEKDKYRVTISLKVRIADINYAGHVGNAEMVGLLHQARAEGLAELGFSEMNIGQDSVGVMMADLAVMFKSESFLHDTLHFDIGFGEFSSKGFRIYYRVRKENSIIALAETGMVAYNYSEGKVTAVPDSFTNQVTLDS